jgi:hypothetical protein
MIYKIRWYPFLLTSYELYNCTGSYYKCWCGSECRIRLSTLTEYKTNHNASIDIK